MKTIAKSFILFLSLFFIAVSCDNDESVSRVVKYEVTGDFTGKLDAITFTSGGGAGDNITKLPYVKESKIYSTGTINIGVALSGTEGKEGETVIIKIYIDNVLEKELTAVAVTDGSIIGKTETELLF